MKKKFGLRTLLALMLAVCLAVGVANMSLAEGTESVPTADNSPAIYVTQKTANSVVGIQVSEETWNNASGRTTTPVAYGSGVCIAEGGYIATNNHVVEDGSSYQVLMPSGEYVGAELVGTDSSTDLAVLKVTDANAASQLVPVEFGSTSDLQVGSTAIAIGNPKGDQLANTVTAGIVSALGRDVSASNTTRKINYIQHDAAINSGNSGGGLFNYKGQLIGINTLRMGNDNTELSTEGLAFAIPVETVQDITSDLIAHGKVIRPQLGVTVLENTEGPDEPMKGYAPVGAMIYSVVEGGPAERAGLQQYDFIYSVDGVRVTSFAELTTELDKHEAGDTVEIQVCRYAQVNVVDNSMMNNNFYGFYGNNSSSSSSRYSIYVSGGYEMVTKSVTLEILDD